MKSKCLALVLLLVSLFLFSGCLYNARKPNAGLCEKVSLQDNKDLCYHEVALETGEDRLCGKIVGVDSRDQCYIDLAAGRTYRSFD